MTGTCLEKLGRLTRPTEEVIAFLLSKQISVWGLALAKELGLFTGTVYPILARLEKLGWVESSWEVDNLRTGPRRKFYRLTESGLIAARELSGRTVRSENFAKKAKHA